ncbi:MAG TPA: fatty acid desaturase [Flavobacteriales bacterium]|nr:fatty acid desaturase [Flavobacteriales bacterium]
MKKNTDYEMALRVLKPFCQKEIKKANWQICSALVFFWSSLCVGFLFYETHPFLLFITIPVSMVFMCRSYVILHDCGHKSFYRSNFWNNVGGSLVGLGIMIPHHMWRYLHNSHHMHVGNLDKRDINPEIWTMTVKEYAIASNFKKIVYRFVRSRCSRFLIFPTVFFGVLVRLVHPKFDWRANVSVIVYDVIYVVAFWFLFARFGFWPVFVVYFIPLFIFCSIVSYVFYAQHQFEDTYWERNENWTYEAATFQGSTYLLAPGWFNWLSGNVVYHNIHHLISTIPNYRLKEAQEALEEIVDFKPISIFSVWSLLGLKLWDENKKKLVSFKEAKATL